MIDFCKIIGPIWAEIKYSGGQWNQGLLQIFDLGKHQEIIDHVVYYGSHALIAIGMLLCKWL